MGLLDKVFKSKDVEVKSKKTIGKAIIVEDNASDEQFPSFKEEI